MPGDGELARQGIANSYESSVEVSRDILARCPVPDDRRSRHPATPVANRAWPGTDQSRPDATWDERGGSAWLPQAQEAPAQETAGATAMHHPRRPDSRPGGDGVVGGRYLGLIASAGKTLAQSTRTGIAGSCFIQASRIFPRAPQRANSSCSEGLRPKASRGR